MRKHILDLQGLLYSEPRLLLLEELREPRNYFSILGAIAQGSTRLNEIAQKAGVGNSPTTARYLDILQHLRLVYRSVPATESQPGISKKGFYHISNYFLRFWFRYVHPYQNSLDLGMADGILEQRVRPTFEQSVIIGRRMYVVSESDWHGYPTEPKTKNGSNTGCETMEQNQLLSVLKIGLYPGSTRASFSSTGYSSGFSNRLPDLTPFRVNTDQLIGIRLLFDLEALQMPQQDAARAIPISASGFGKNAIEIDEPETDDPDPGMPEMIFYLAEKLDDHDQSESHAIFAPSTSRGFCND